MPWIYNVNIPQFQAQVLNQQQKLHSNKIYESVHCMKEHWNGLNICIWLVYFVVSFYFSE